MIPLIWETPSAFEGGRRSQGTEKERSRLDSLRIAI